MNATSRSLAYVCIFGPGLVIAESTYKRSCESRQVCMERVHPDVRQLMPTIGGKRILESTASDLRTPTRPVVRLATSGLCPTAIWGRTAAALGFDYRRWAILNSCQSRRPNRSCANLCFGSKADATPKAGMGGKRTFPDRPRVNTAAAGTPVTVRSFGTPLKRRRRDSSCLKQMPGASPYAKVRRCATVSEHWQPNPRTFPGRWASKLSDFGTNLPR